MYIIVHMESTNELGLSKTYIAKLGTELDLPIKVSDDFDKEDAVVCYIEPLVFATLEDVENHIKRTMGWDQILIGKDISVFS